MDIKRSVKETEKALGINHKLKKAQVKAIHDIMHDRDVLVIARVGFGKSAVFQIPAILKKGVILIVLPTLSLIDYYQQAGRDGNRAKCVLFYNKSDYISNRYIIEQNQSSEAMQYALNALDAMKEYADEDRGCMVQRMLSALGEELEKHCGRCTNCQKERKRT